MVNEITDVSSVSVLAPRPGMPRSAPVVPAADAGRVASGGGITFRNAGLVSSLNDRQDAQAQVAVQVRSTQVGLGAIDTRLDEMKAVLLQITKQYPPYPPDSTQRVTLLNQIEGLRKQLETLVIPPPFRFPSQQPLRLAQASEAQAPAVVGLNRQDVSLPVLDPRRASDAEVADALGQVEQAQQQVEVVRQAMWADVARFVTRADPAQAEAQSQKVRGYLATTPGASLSGAQAQVLSAAAA